MSAVDERDSARQSSLRHYAALLEIAEQGLQASLRGDLDELASLSRRWDELVAILPALPPAAAEPLLRRAALLNEAATAQLSRLRQKVMQEISLTARASRAAHGYAAQSAPRVRVDRRA